MRKKEFHVQFPQIFFKKCEENYFDYYFDLVHLKAIKDT